MLNRKMKSKIKPADENSFEENNDVNNTEILRRSTRISTKPKYLEDYAILALNAESFVENVPESFADIKNRNDKEYWEEAVKEELNSLMENETWSYSTLPSNKRLINSKWIFKLKRDKEGNVERYKARLVIKGCSQKKGYDYDETYAPVARLGTLRTLLALINEEDLFVEQMDVKNAFLHGELEEEIYMKIPEGVEYKNGLVCRLNKTLYGLKQAPRGWNRTFDNFIKTLGMDQSNVDKCLYIGVFKDYKIYLLLYVDDILIAGNNRIKIEEMKTQLKTRFHMKEMGEPQSYLGINISRKNDEIHLSQPIYLQNLLKRFNMQDCKPVNTPMEVNLILELENSKMDTSKPCRELIGCLMYAMLATRPDLSAAVNYLSRHQNNPSETLWKCLKRVLRYIKGTLDISLRYKKGNQDVLVGYADANWGSEVDRKSTSGYLLQVYGNTVCWATKRQTCVSLSSTEAEYVALATATSEYLWLKNLLTDLQVDFKLPLKMYEDNQSCIHLLHRWEHRRLKHIDIKYNFIRDLYAKGVIDVQFLRTEDQVADILTKAFAKSTICQTTNVTGFNLNLLLFVSLLLIYIILVKQLNCGGVLRIQFNV